MLKQMAFFFLMCAGRWIGRVAGSRIREVSRRHEARRREGCWITNSRSFSKARSTKARRLLDHEFAKFLEGTKHEGAKVAGSRTSEVSRRREARSAKARRLLDHEFAKFLEGTKHEGAKVAGSRIREVSRRHEARRREGCWITKSRNREIAKSLLLRTVKEPAPHRSPLRQVCSLRLPRAPWDHHRHVRYNWSFESSQRILLIVD